MFLYRSLRCCRLLKGVKNTKIALQFSRQGKPTTEIVLDEVAIKSVPYYAKIDDKTGYIVLARFNQKASNETKQALEDLKIKEPKESC
jgi:carboxyl-terminal processing protease